MDAATTAGEVHRRKWRLRLPERLPNLKGKWLTIYTVVWAIVLPLSVIGAVWGAYLSAATPPMWSPYGIATSEDATGLHVDAVFSSAARSAGVEVGDYVVGIDGWEVPKTAARAAARPRIVKADGAATTFAIRKPDGRIREARLIRSNAIEEQRFRDAGTTLTFGRAAKVVGSILIPLLFIPAAVLLFIRKRSEAVPAYLSLSFLLLASIATGGDIIGISVNLVEFIAGAGTALLYLALFAFPAGRFDPRWTAVPACFLPIILIPAYLIPTQLQVLGWALSIAFPLLALTALASRYRRVGRGAERQQLRWAFFCLATGTILLGLTFVGLVAASAWQAEDPRWLVWQYAFVQSLLTLAFCVMALGLIVSMLRYRLYDADAVIGRSAAYGLLTIGFVALFAASQKIIELLGQEYLGQNIGGLAGGIGAALAAVAIAPMHARAQRWAERRFQRSLYKLRHALPPLVGDLRETAELEQIGGATLDAVVDGVRAQRAALVAGEQLVDARNVEAADVRQWLGGWSPPAQDGIECDRSDRMFPVRVPLEAEGHGRVGWLLLGARPDGSLFGKAEWDAIEEIAEPVARAVQVAISRAEREERYERRFEAIEQMIAQLKARRRCAET